MSQDNQQIKEESLSLRQVIISLLEYYLMFTIIIEFNTPYIYLPGVGSLLLYSAVFSLILLILLRGALLIDNMIIGVFIVTSFLSMNVIEGQLQKYIKWYLLLLPLLLVLFTGMLRETKNVYNRLLIKYSNIVLVISLVSLFFWSFGSVLEMISPNGLIPTKWGEERFLPTYYGIYFETQNTYLSSESIDSIIRNSGFFNEAPMYNMVLCTSLSVELFLKKEIPKVRVLVLIITILSTMSTTGYFFLMFLLFLKLYNRKSKTSLLRLFFPILLGLGLYLSYAILDNKRETSESSYVNRGSDIQRCIEIGLENPISGVGIFHEANEWGSNKNNFGFSNSLFSTFAHGGVFFFVFYAFSLLFIPLLVFRKGIDPEWASIVLCYFFLFTFTVSQYNFLSLFFVAYSLSYWDIIILQNSENYEEES